MNFLVPFTLFGWIPFVILLFVLLPPRRAVGYAETSSFSSSFRKATGMSPSEFRRALTVNQQARAWPKVGPFRD